MRIAPRISCIDPPKVAIYQYGSEQVYENFNFNAVNTNSNIVNVSLVQNASNRTKFTVGVPVVVFIKPNKYLDFDANL